MKNYFKIILSIFFVFSALSCESDEERLVDLNNLAAPANLGATFQITQDNSGLVTIIPTGQGATLYNIDFGDGSPVSENIKVGEKVEHIYAEGQYEVGITGKNLNGETAQGTQALTVSFLPPENLEAVITPDPTNNYRVTVSATAENAAMFEVYFGETEDEEPVPLMAGETVEHIYDSIGTYTIRVVALSGGAATTEITQEITITDPLFLPIDFESETLDYTWAGFGGATGSVIDNPDTSGINTSAKVTQLIKSNGAQTWAGISLDLDEPVDFSEGNIIKMKVWSPEAGVPILFKLEDPDSPPNEQGNPSVFVEVIQNTTTSGEWEELSFDLSSFADFDPTITYERAIVFYDYGNTGEGTTFYFDDITSPVSGQGGGDAPSVAAPAPELPAENVISMFSGAYTNVPVDTWAASWSKATLEEVSVAGNPVKKYSDLDFVGIETTSSPIDASGMTHFHTDIWTGDITEFRIKLVDFGADGVFQGGDDVEYEVSITSPAQNQWVSIDVPLEDFTGLTTKEHIAQLIYSASPTGTGTVYVDNVYFHN